MGKITIEKNRIIFERKDEITVLEPYGKNCIRCRSTRNASVSEESWTLLPPKTSPQCTIEGDEKKAVLTNGDLSVKVEAGEIWYGGILTYYRKGKQILHTRYEGEYTMRNQHRGGNLYTVKVIFDSNPGEHIYGLGQEQANQFDKKGCTSDMINYNTKTGMPVYYSSLGYGFFWNNPSPGRCETTKNHIMWCSEWAYQADYLVYSGDTPADVLKSYCDLTGYAPDFPAWAAGFWQCKLRYESQEDLLEVAREYKRRGIPIDVIVIDYFHWTEQGEWKLDPEYWPDPEKMCRELEELGIRPVISIWPTINPASENYTEMSEGNMLLRTEQGQFGTFDFYGQQTFIDPMNPKTGKFVWDKVKKNYYDKGIQTFWLDEAEPEVHPQHFENLHFYKGNGGEVALLYPYYYCKMFYDHLKEEGEEEILLLTRSAYPGSQRYGAAVWNGDIPSTFEALETSVKSGLSMGMCGIPWWNSDIGGFLNGDTESEYFRELIVRWFQFGLFSPIMRLHGSRLKPKGHVDRHPGVKESSGGDNEIWSFGEQNYPVLKRLIRIRENLRPYIMDAMREATQTGKPLMRPMFFEFYEDETCYLLEDQYMFGGDILFAPITKQGCVEREVYLPDGNWISVLDGKVYSGGQTLVVHAELDEFVAYIREERKELMSCFDESGCCDV